MKERVRKKLTEKGHVEQEMSNTIGAIGRPAEPRVEQAARRTATDNRAPIATEIATTKTKDPERLKGLVSEYILEATRNVAAPGGQLEAIKKTVINLRRGDPGFSRLVNEVGDYWTQRWQAQGRSREVWGRLEPLIRKGDWAGVKAEVSRQLKTTLAETSPTMGAIQNYQNNTLLAYGPKDPRFRQEVFNAVNELITTGPASAASEIAGLRDSQGLAAAANRLRKLTEETTPLEAALILKEAKPTIDIICQALNPNAVEQYSKGRNAYIAHKQQIFNDLAAAVDSASRSQDATQTIEQIGSALARSQVSSFVNVAEAVAEGNLSLPLEMLKQLGGP